MDKKKETKSALPKIIFVIAIVAIAAVIIYVVAGASAPTLSTADPANVVTQSSDLPSGWSVTESMYKSAPDYEANFPTYTGTAPEIGYYVGFSNGSAVYVSEAMRFASVSDAESFYDYLHGRLPVGAVIYPDTIGDESITFIVGENIGGLLRKSNVLVNNAVTDGALTLSEFTDYLQTSASRI